MEATAPTLHDINAKLELLMAVILVTKTVLSLEEAARYIGLAESYVYKLTSTQQIPFYKPLGKKLYFKREELDNWLLKRRIQTTDEINAAPAKHVSGVRVSV